MTDHVRQSTLVDRVREQIRQMILDEGIEPGEYLPSRKQLALRFGVGLSTIHEAIQALTAVGLLASRPGKGTWLRSDALETLIHPNVVERRLGKLEIQSLYEARTVIEVALTELAAERATPADLQAMQVALAKMEAALDDDDAFVAADLAFHDAIARAGHNPLLEQFYHLTRKLLSQVIRQLIQVPQTKINGIRIQSEIAAAIQAGDRNQARQAALDHMQVIAGLLAMF